MIDAVSVKHRYLALWFPFLSTDRWRIGKIRRSGQATGATPPEDAGDAPLPPLAMVAKVRGALRLAAVDARAQTLGILPGMTLADARALEPELAVAEMDDGADRHWLDRLARDCLDWSPRVTLAGPDGITLDIAGVDHLFGGEAGLCAQIEELHTLDDHTQATAAPSASGDEIRRPQAPRERRKHPRDVRILPKSRDFH